MGSWMGCHKKWRVREFKRDRNSGEREREREEEKEKNKRKVWKDGE